MLWRRWGTRLCSPSFCWGWRNLNKYELFVTIHASTSRCFCGNHHNECNDVLCLSIPLPQSLLSASPHLFRKTVLGVKDEMYLFSLLVNTQVRSVAGRWMSAAAQRVLRPPLRHTVLQPTEGYAQMPRRGIVFCCPAQWKLITEDGKRNFFFLQATHVASRDEWKKDFENTCVIIMEKVEKWCWLIHPWWDSAVTEMITRQICPYRMVFL